MLPIVFTIDQDALNYFCYKLTNNKTIVMLTAFQELNLGNLFIIGLN